MPRVPPACGCTSTTARSTASARARPARSQRWKALSDLASSTTWRATPSQRHPGATAATRAGPGERRHAGRRPGDDTLSGDAGNDVLVGGGGADFMDGGATATRPTTARRQDPSRWSWRPAMPAARMGPNPVVDRSRAGSSFRDSLTATRPATGWRPRRSGRPARRRRRGHLIGPAGKDVLDGGGGADRMSGGRARTATSTRPSTTLPRRVRPAHRPRRRGPHPAHRHRRQGGQGRQPGLRAGRGFHRQVRPSGADLSGGARPDAA